MHVIKRQVFYFNLMSFFEFLKQIHIKISVQVHILHWGPRAWLHRHKLSVFLKKTPTQISESDNILCLVNILRLKYVLVENSLSFSDLTLRYSMWELSLEYSKVTGQRNQNPLDKQTQLFPWILKKRVHVWAFLRIHFTKYIGTNAYG
jgi:hypothetical protein